jgi:hypothetical protein
MSMCGELENLEKEYATLYRECTLLMSKYHERYLALMDVKQRIDIMNAVMEEKRTVN